MLERLNAVQRYKQHDNEQSDFRCPVCGNHDFTSSTITLQANYGSIHDGERVTLHVCENCFDRLLGFVGVFAVTMSESGLTAPLFED